MKSFHSNAVRLLSLAALVLSACSPTEDEGARVFPGEYDTVFQDNLLRRRTATLTLNQDGTGKYYESLDEVCPVEQSTFNWKYGGDALTFTNLKTRKVRNCEEQVWKLDYLPQSDSLIPVRHPNKCHFETEIGDSYKKNISNWFIWESASYCSF